MDFITINSSNKTEEFALKQVAKQATSSLMYRLGKNHHFSECVRGKRACE